MSCRLWSDQDQLPYYELVCDGCGACFTCYDDSCYDWRLLRDAALYAGWDTRGPHRCPSCQYDTGGRTEHDPVLPGIEVPHADHAEQQQPVIDDDRTDVPAPPQIVEIPDADAAEQRQPVPLNDDGYPTTR